MVTGVELIYSKELAQQVLHFVEHTDAFPHFGIRMFQHFCLSSRLRKELSEWPLTYFTQWPVARPLDCSASSPASSAPTTTRQWWPACR